MNFYLSCLMLVAFFINFTAIDASLKWIVNLSQEHSEWNRGMCSMRKYGFSSKQRGVCRKHLNDMYYASVAAREAVKQCWLETSWDRWTCANLLDNITDSPDLATATRARAFVQSVSAASIVWTFISNCATGKIKDCVCPRAVTNGRVTYIQYVCETNFNRGQEFAQNLLNVGAKKLEKLKRKAPEKSVLVKIDEHNRDVGYRTLHQIKEKRCVCPGMTGGCVKKICYPYLPDLRKTVLELRNRKEEAVVVNINKEEKTFTPNDDPNDVISNEELVITDTKLDRACVSWDTFKQYGFSRTCYLGNETTKYENHDKRLCKEICCGGKFKKEKVSVKVLTNKCSFKYCCDVVCEHYTYYTDHYFCE